MPPDSSFSPLAIVLNVLGMIFNTAVYFIGYVLPVSLLLSWPAMKAYNTASFAVLGDTGRSVTAMEAQCVIIFLFIVGKCLRG